MRSTNYKWLVVAALYFACVRSGVAEELFSKTVGPVPVGSVSMTPPLQVPYITWGGDIATFYANGGLDTKPGTIFQQQGLNLHLVPGDDFVQQVRDYMAGKSPFLRGTFNMIGQASEVIGSDRRTMGVVIMQLTWSAGDHMVGRTTIKDRLDLKGKTIALQAAGPHIGMLDDILKTAQLGWNDINVVWAQDLTASSNCPAELFRNNKNIDACFCITPDMIGLCGGLKKTGTGAEGTVKDARVVISTVDLSKSIADVYVCRKDFYDANKDMVTKFVAGSLKAAEDVVKLRNGYEDKRLSSSDKSKYMGVLKLAQDIYTTNVIKSLDEDAHGLLLDANFVGYPGNWKFFKWGGGNTVGFESFVTKNLDLATERGYAKERIPMLAPDFDLTAADFTGILQDTTRPVAPRLDVLPEPIGDAAFQGGDVYLSFSIHFNPNDYESDRRAHEDDYKHVITTLARFSHSAFIIRGHSDPTMIIGDIVGAGLKKGILEVSFDTTTSQKVYTFHGRPLDVASIEAIRNAISSGEFDGVEGFDPRGRMEAAQDLSLQRAKNVRDDIIAYAREHGLILDPRLFKVEGIGIREPVVKRPKSMADVKANLRAQFNLIPIQAEVRTGQGGSSPFDY